MKFKITLKDPDGFYDSIQDSVRDEINKLGLPSDEAELLIEARTEKVNEFLEQWVGYGEYVTIEFDTEEKTATVVSR